MAIFRMAVFDDSPDYIDKFILYMKNSHRLPFDISGFTEVTALKKYITENPVDILLIALDDPEQVAALGRLVGKCILLSEKKESLSVSELGVQGSASINKFQSMQKIASRLLVIYREMTGNTAATFDLEFDTFGIWSLGSVDIKIDLAFQLARSLSHNGSVLYIEPERFSGLTMYKQIRTTKSLADVIYLYKTGSARFRETLQQAVFHIGSLDVLTGVAATEDLGTIDADSWSPFLREIVAAGGYSSVIIGITELFQSPVRLFEICKTLYIGGADDSVGRYRLRLKEMTDYYNSIGRGDLLGRIFIAGK